jgi:hypothetical protein
MGVINIIFYGFMILVVPFLASAQDSFPVFNARLGTQTFHPKYQFTNKTKLVETAQAIYEMGSDTIKFGMNATWSGDYYGLPANPEIHTLVDLAQKEPSYKAVLDMPFYNYLIWVYPFEGVNWRDGLSAAEAQREYQQVYDFAAYLLKTYSRTQKSFFFGHWEGDWWLLGNYDAKSDPGETAIQGMIDWLKVRQKAVEQARQDVAHSEVAVWNYVEVNLVKKAMEGGTTITNDILPHVRLDAVSYSAYDTIFDSTATFVNALEYIESKAVTTGHFQKDVFVGEYGFPLDHGKRTPEEQARLSEAVFTAAMAWGCPFVLYWQMYDNEAEANGVNARGFWLIDARNEKQPVYHRHQLFLGKAHTFKNVYRVWLRRNPSEAEFSDFAKRHAAFQVSDELRRLLDSREYHDRISSTDYGNLLWSRFFPDTPPVSHPVYQQVAQMLADGTARSTVLFWLMDSSIFRAKLPDSSFADYIWTIMLAQSLGDEPSGFYQKMRDLVNHGLARSDAWCDALNHDLFFHANLAMRTQHAKEAESVKRLFFIDPQAVPAAFPSGVERMPDK